MKITKNKRKFNALIKINEVMLPVSNIEKQVLITAIEREIKHRFQNAISSDNGEDIICLHNILENLNVK